MTTEKNLETVFNELDNVVKQLEGDNITLEESFQLYHKGMDLLKICNDKIDTIEKKMKMLDENGEEYDF